jgi:hypothetical protein
MRVQMAVGAAAIAVVLLTGCTPPPAEGDDTPAPSTEPTPIETATAEPGTPEFAMPDECVEIITPETAADFAAAGLDLLGGPGGVYGENYFGDPTPEEQVGGITCVWGDEEVPASTVIVSVAPITASTQSDVVSSLSRAGWSSRSWTARSPTHASATT